MTTIEQLKDKLKKLTSRWYYSKEEIDNSFVDNTSFNSSISAVYNTFNSYQRITMGYGTSYQNKNVVTDNTGKITVEEKPTIPSKISDLNNDSNFIETSNTNGLIKNDGTIDTNTYSQTNHTHSGYLTSNDIINELNGILDDIFQSEPLQIVIQNWYPPFDTFQIFDFTTNDYGYTDENNISHEYKDESILSYNRVTGNVLFIPPTQLPLEKIKLQVHGGSFPNEWTQYYYFYGLEDNDNDKIINVLRYQLPTTPPTEE